MKKTQAENCQPTVSLSTANKVGLILRRARGAQGTGDVLQKLGELREGSLSPLSRTEKRRASPDSPGFSP